MFSLMCCFNTARIVSQYVSLSSNKLLIQAICEKTVLEVLNTRIVLLKQYTEIGVNWLIVIGNKVKANIQITTSYSKFAC